MLDSKVFAVIFEQCSLQIECIIRSYTLLQIVLKLICPLFKQIMYYLMNSLKTFKHHQVNQKRKCNNLLSMTIVPKVIVMSITDTDATNQLVDLLAFKGLIWFVPGLLLPQSLFLFLHPCAVIINP